jgi:hypothetical protein
MTASMILALVSIVRCKAWWHWNSSYFNKPKTWPLGVYVGWLPSYVQSVYFCILMGQAVDKEIHSATNGKWTRLFVEFNSQGC